MTSPSALAQSQQDWTEDELLDVAVAAALAFSSSMSSQTISPKLWWDRLESALSASAERSYSWTQLMACAAQSLQIAVLTKRSGSVLCSIGREHGLEGPRFERLRSMLETQTPAVIAFARAERDAQKRGEASMLSPRMRRVLEAAALFQRATEEEDVL